MHEIQTIVMMIAVSVCLSVCLSRGSIVCGAFDTAFAVSLLSLVKKKRCLNLGVIQLFVMFVTD